MAQLSADCSIHQVFFHRYFTQRKQREGDKAAKIAKRKGHGEASDTEDEVDIASDVEELPAGTDDENEEDSDKEEAEIWKVRVRAKRRLHIVTQKFTLHFGV